jgi:glycosyltransferase involved in cell wall biosynthesis
MKTIVILGLSNITEEASRNKILCRAFSLNAKKIIYNTCSLGNLKPETPLLIKMIFSLLLAPLRWFVLICKYLILPQHDIIFVPYPSYVDGLLGCIFGKLFNKIVIIDSFLGIYDTLVDDRCLFDKNGIPAKLIWYYEKWFLSLADYIIVDTDCNKDLLRKTYCLPEKKITSIPVGIDENIWKPVSNDFENKSYRVIFWCTFIPLHGVNIVAKTASLIEKKIPDIEFIVIGTGQEAAEFKQLLKAINPKNLKWIDHFLSLDDIYNLVQNSHCCLGIFGGGDKTQRVIPYKVYQALACAQPVITARTKASQSLFTHGKNVLLVNPNDPNALANAIETVWSDRKLARQLGKNGRLLYEKMLSNKIIEKKVGQFLGQL